MKNKHLTIPGLLIMFSIVIFSCQKKNDTGNSPGYKEETGTGGNPFPNNPTVTGTPTSTNPATQNSNLVVGGTGWSNPSCVSTNDLILTGINGGINVSINFFSAPATGTYVIAAAPSPSQACTMLVTNAPNQPTGTVWYGKSGLVSVTTNSTNTSLQATFSGIICTQQTFSFPQVSVSGNIGCN